MGLDVYKLDNESPSPLRVVAANVFSMYHSLWPLFNTITGLPLSQYFHSGGQSSVKHANSVSCRPHKKIPGHISVHSIWNT